MNIIILFIVLSLSPFQEQRAQISRAFHEWIRECHDAHDKQVRFIIISFLKVNCLLLKLNRKLKKMFASPRRELNPQPSDLWSDALTRKKATMCTCSYVVIGFIEKILSTV